MIKKILLFPLLISIILLFRTDVVGQEPFYWQLTEEDGLPSMTIYQVHQDKKGFIWFGTENGICRYDGKEMETFYHPDLLDNEILKIQEDTWGRIWFKNLAGQIAFVENGRIVIKDIEKRKRLLNICIVDNFLVVTSLKESHFRLIEKYEIKEDGEVLLSFQKVMETGFFMAELEPNKERVYTFFRFLDKQDIILEFNIITDELRFIPISEKVKEPQKIMINQANSILLSGSGETNYFKIENDSCKLIRKANFNISINALLEMPNELLFNYEGLTIINEDEILHFFNDFKMNTVLEDKTGNIWIGTRGKGVLFLHSIEVLNYTKNNSKVASDHCFSIYPFSDSELIIGQDEGRISIIESNNIKERKIRKQGRVRAIAQDAFGRFWFGGDNSGIKAFNENLLESFFFKKIGGIKSLNISNSNSILIGTNSSSIQVDINPTFEGNVAELKNLKNGYEFVNLHPNNEKKIAIKELHSGRTYAIFESQNSIWLGTSSGIYKYQNEESMPFLENNKHISYSVSGITQSKDSTLWFSTQGHGVVGIKNDSITYRLDENSGLATNNCNNLFYDEYNNLWIGSKKGLHKLNLNTFEIDIINKYDGMPTDEISAIYARDSIVWIGTQKGLVKIPYSAIQKNKIPPPIHITNVAFWDKDTTLLPSYDLEYNQNNINIEFVGITYRNRGNTKYQYRMIGLDTNWVSTNTRFVRYPILNPESYVFQVKAINEDGIESRILASIQFNINRPWWQTWWFYFITLFSGIGLISFFFYRRVKQNNERREIDRKFNELRMMALQAQMNPHFVFNALSAIQKFLTTDEREEAMIYLARFAQLIRTIFEQSKEKLITLEEEFEFLKLYIGLEKLRFQDKVEIDFIIDETITKDDYDIQIPPLIIQPIIENAFKHGLMHKEEGGKLKIEFLKEKEFLICRIEDNGVGRKMAKELGEDKLRQGRSSGLNMAKERLGLLNESLLENESFNNLIIEDLMDDNQNPIGTRVEIKIKSLANYYS